MHVASRSTTVRGVITASSLVEGIPVKLTDSGVVNSLNTDLPIVTGAESGLNPVYILAAAPDDFPRPVDLRQYQAGWRVVSDKTLSTGYSEPLEAITRYNIGMSNLYNPTLPSGVVANAHKGGTYTVPNTVFNDTAAIRVVGAYVEVGSNNKWQYTALRTNAVGEVIHYNSETNELTFMLWQH